MIPQLPHAGIIHIVMINFQRERGKVEGGKESFAEAKNHLLLKAKHMGISQQPQQETQNISIENNISVQRKSTKTLHQLALVNQSCSFSVSNF